MKRATICAGLDLASSIRYPLKLLMMKTKQKLLSTDTQQQSARRECHKQGFGDVWVELKFYYFLLLL